MKILINTSQIPLEVIECLQDVAGGCADNNLGPVYTQLVEVAAGRRQALEFSMPAEAAAALDELLYQTRFWTLQAHKEKRLDYGEFALFCGVLASQIHELLSITKASN
jgi:hypothetical protein